MPLALAVVPSLLLTSHPLHTAQHLPPINPSKIIDEHTSNAKNYPPLSAHPLQTVQHLAPIATSKFLAKHPSIVRNYADAIATCADTAEWRAACTLLHRLEQLGESITGRPITAAIRACANAGKPSVATALLHRARQGSFKSASRAGYTAAIRAADNAGLSDQSVQLYALAVQERHYNHWREDEPLTIDLRGFRSSVAAAAVKYALTHEIGNFLSSDLKIITGKGCHSIGGEPYVLPRIKNLLTRELSTPLRYSFSNELRCNGTACQQHENRDCLVVRVDDLLHWLMKSRDFDSFIVRLDMGDTSVVRRVASKDSDFVHLPP